MIQRAFFLIRFIGEIKKKYIFAPLLSIPCDGKLGSKKKN